MPKYSSLPSPNPVSLRSFRHLVEFSFWRFMPHTFYYEFHSRNVSQKCLNFHSQRSTSQSCRRNLLIVVRRKSGGEKTKERKSGKTRSQETSKAEEIRRRRRKRQRRFSGRRKFGFVGRRSRRRNAKGRGKEKVTNRYVSSLFPNTCISCLK